MKNSGGEPEGNANDVLDLGRWHTQVVGDVREAIAGLEAIYEVLHARATVNHERLSECLVGIHEATLDEDDPDSQLLARKLARGDLDG